MVSPRIRRAIGGVCFLAISFNLAAFGTTPPGPTTTPPPGTTIRAPPRPAIPPPPRTTIPNPPSRTIIPPRTTTTTATGPHSPTTTTTASHPATATTTTTRSSVGKPTHAKGAHFGRSHSAAAAGVGVGVAIDVSRIFQHRSEPEPVYVSSPASLPPNNSNRDTQANKAGESPKGSRSKTTAAALWSRIDLTRKETAGAGLPLNKP